LEVKKAILGLSDKEAYVTFKYKTLDVYQFKSETLCILCLMCKQVPAIELGYKIRYRMFFKKTTVSQYFKLKASFICV